MTTKTVPSLTEPVPDMATYVERALLSQPPSYADIVLSVGPFDMRLRGDRQGNPIQLLVGFQSETETRTFSTDPNEIRDIAAAMEGAARVMALIEERFAAKSTSGTKGNAG